MAVGNYLDPSHRYHSLAQTWDRGVWRVLKAPPGKGLLYVSCTSPEFCMAYAGRPDGEFSGTERWNGKTWLTMASPPQPGQPSCGDRRLCMVVTSGTIETWFGRKWRVYYPQVCNVPNQPCGLNDLACGNGINCMAVGFTATDQSGDQEAEGQYWNGKSFNWTLPPGYEGDDGAVACAGSFCMVGGETYSEDSQQYFPTAATWTTSGGWTDITSTLDLPACGGYCSLTSNMSCGSPANCMSFDGGGHLWWNGARWQEEPSVSAGRGSDLGRVACGGSICVAVGYRTVHGVVRTLAELWNGTSWKILPTPRVT